MGYQNCVIVGSDLFDLKASIIETFEKLVTHEVVIGPAEDGGYYYWAKTKQSSYFPKQKLGTDTVKATMKDLKGHQISLLETLNDIDTLKIYNAVRTII
jgi:glycosyltransferase A (GT-A) superfamily protein (DUF2064 family)